MAPELEKEHGGVDPDSRLTEYISFVGNKLTPFSLRPDFPRRFKVLKSDKIVNAFALGNGNVYITRALLNLIEDEAELAEVLGHENGHIGLRHIAKRIDQAVGTAGLLSLAEAVYLSIKGKKVSEKDQEMIEVANRTIPTLVLNGFGREQELEADQHGLDAMVKAGYDPMGSVRVFQRFQKLEGEVPALQVFFRSHPTARVRISDLESSIRKRYPGATGETFRDRYQAIVHGGMSLSEFERGTIAGISAPVAVAGGVVLVGVAALVVLYASKAI